jgi:hypothetical protein
MIVHVFLMDRHDLARGPAQARIGSDQDRERIGADLSVEE